MHGERGRRTDPEQERRRRAQSPSARWGRRAATPSSWPRQGVRSEAEPEEPAGRQAGVGSRMAWQTENGLRQKVDEAVAASKWDLDLDKSETQELSLSVTCMHA